MDYARENGVGTVVIFGVLGLGLAGGLGYYLYSRSAAGGGSAAAAVGGSAPFSKEKAVEMALAEAVSGTSGQSTKKEDFKVVETRVLEGTDAAPVAIQVTLSLWGMPNTYRVTAAGVDRTAKANPRRLAHVHRPRRLGIRR